VSGEEAASWAHVRRRDRAIDDDAWIAAALRDALVGRLATVHDGRPFLNANLFVYDPDRHAIYLHTARRGRTRDNVESAHPAPACFEISEMGRILPAEEALEFSVEYAGVVVFGDIAIVDDEDEAERALQALLDKVAPHLRPGRDYRAIQPDELRRTSVYRIDVRSWSGKRKVACEAFPGAFVPTPRSLLRP
jgi:nitroimidazol reductase NimA-like FMN-containing flavoprotein (pyridoxamine 5'-phosphate oxidase superfamily)